MERMIALTTKVAATYSVDEDAPLGSRFEQEMSNAILSRQVMSYFKSKQDYRPHRLRRYSTPVGPRRNATRACRDEETLPEVT